MRCMALAVASDTADSLPMTNRDVPIRDAATIVLVRRDGSEPAVLMGQRGAGAAFMASKFVFPGGAVSDTDARLPETLPLPAGERARLERWSSRAPEALAHAAIRELWEEAGLALGVPAEPRSDVPPDWRSFYARCRPSPDRLRFFFRAVTPPGRPRRFDARFFLCPAESIHGDPDDFSASDAELSHLHWVALSEARRLALPFITELVLAEVEAMLPDLSVPDMVPFFRQGAEGPGFEMIRASAP